MIEKIIDKYNVELKDRREELQLCENIIGDYSYSRNTYNKDDNLIGTYKVTPITNYKALTEFRIEKDKYDRLFEDEYFLK